MKRPPSSKLAVIGSALALAVSLAAGSARAGGFLIYEQSPSALAQGGAFVARADDPSAIFYNPAGLALHPRVAALAGATAIISSTTASRLPPAGTTADADTRLFTPPTLYVTAPVGQRVALGLGAFTQYGLGMTWPKDWPGRFRIISADAQSVTVNPTVAVHLLPGLYAGAGFDFVYATFDMRQSIDLVQTEGSVHVAGASTAYGANAGLLWDAVPGRLRLGLAYRSATHLRINGGKADFTAPPEFAQQLRDQSVESVIRTPHLIALAGSIHVSESFSLSLDVVYATWQSFRWFFFDFPQNADLSTFEREDWHNTVAVRSGGEWKVGEHWLLRAGVGFDQTPVPSATLNPVIPDANRLLASVGAARDFGPFRAELGYMAVLFVDSDLSHQRVSHLSTFPALYESAGHLVGAALQYRH